MCEIHSIRFQFVSVFRVIQFSFWFQRSFSPISEASNTSSNEENESCGISLLSFSQLRKQGNLALPSSMFNLDPYRSAVRKMIPATTPHCADIWAFYDALELVDTAKDTLPTSWQYHGLFKQLHATMDAAVAYGRWFCADDPPSDQLAVHFLIVLKTHLLNHIRDSPLVGLVDNSMDLSTRMALEMLWKAIHLVEHVAFLIAEMGVAVCLVDLTFSPSVSSSCKAIALNILEAFLLLVPSHRILQIIGEQYRKNSTGSMESRLDKLLELRLSVEIPLELLFDSDENDVSAERAVMEMTILVLEKLLTSAMEWRRFLVQNPPSGRSLVDEGGVVWSCVKKGGFLPWFSKVARKILLSEEGNVKGFRLRMVVVEVLDLLVRDGFGVAFLAMELQSKTGSSLIEVSSTVSCLRHRIHRFEYTVDVCCFARQQRIRTSEIKLLRSHPKTNTVYESKYYIKYVNFKLHVKCLNINKADIRRALCSGEVWTAD